MTQRERLLRTVKNSELTQGQRRQFLAFTQFVGEDELSGLVDLFEQKPKLVVPIFENMRKKYEAVREGRMNELQEILQEEREIIKQLA